MALSIAPTPSVAISLRRAGSPPAKTCCSRFGGRRVSVSPAGDVQVIAAARLALSRSFVVGFFVFGAVIRCPSLGVRAFQEARCEPSQACSLPLYSSRLLLERLSEEL